MMYCQNCGHKLTKNNVITEDIKGLNHGGKITILPQMEINTHDILANHLVTISALNNNDLFYLQSKGISEAKAQEIILKGFITGTFPKYIDILFGGEKSE